jgi:glycosyltransferase involved in cell wall biosynthesis
MPRRPPDLRLVIAGLPGLDEERLERTVAGLADPSAIVRVSSIDEMQRSNLLYGASVLAYPSFDEGFGFPPLEAMTAGVPVVASTGGSIPEVVGDAAILTPPGDVGALAGAMADALEDPLRTDLVERGSRRLAAHSWERTAEGLADLYRRATDRS